MHFNFKKTIDSPVGDASVLRIFTSKNTTFWPYVLKAFGEPNKDFSSETIGTYLLNVGDEKEIKAIPINVPVDYASGFIECRFSKDGHCPDMFKMDMSKAVYIYASPNNFSLFIQWLLIFAFWVVIFNSFLGLLHRDWFVSNSE